MGYYENICGEKGAGLFAGGGGAFEVEDEAVVLVELALGGNAFVDHDAVGDGIDGDELGAVNMAGVDDFVGSFVVDVEGAGVAGAVGDEAGAAADFEGGGGDVGGGGLAGGEEEGEGEQSGGQ